MFLLGLLARIPDNTACRVQICGGTYCVIWCCFSHRRCSIYPTNVQRSWQKEKATHMCEIKNIKRWQITHLQWRAALMTATIPNHIYERNMAEGHPFFSNKSILISHSTVLALPPQKNVFLASITGRLSWTQIIFFLSRYGWTLRSACAVAVTTDEAVTQSAMTRTFASVGDVCGHFRVLWKLSYFWMLCNNKCVQWCACRTLRGVVCVLHTVNTSCMPGASVAYAVLRICTTIVQCEIY